jgi:type I restriction enzyme S subunit
MEVEKTMFLKDWEVLPLGEVCKTTSGGTPDRKNKSYYDGDIPWVKSGELAKGLILDTEEKISEEAVRNSSAKIFPKGTLLIALYGATIGKLSFLGIDAATNQAVCGIFKNERMDSKFLYYYLFFQKRALVKQAIGGAQPNISQGILKSLTVPIPPPAEQQHIVAKIEELFIELDAGKQQLEKAAQQLRLYRQAVLKWAFEGSHVFNWQVIELDALCEKDRGITYGVIKLGEPTENGVPCLRTSDVRPLKIDTSTVKLISKQISDNYRRTLLQGGEVLVNVRGSLGGVAVVDEKMKGWNVSREIAVVPILKDVNPLFIAYQVASNRCQAWLKGVTKGIAYAGINLQDLRTLPINIPELNKQNAIVQEIEAKLSVCDKMEETIAQSMQQAEALRQSILKKAFEGSLVDSISKM